MAFFMSFLSLEAIIDHELGREAIRRADPAVALVLGESRREARSILLNARARGVPTVALQHGRFADHHFALTTGDLQGNDLVGDLPLPTRFAVYGTRDRDYLVEKARIPANRVVVTGAPRWDVLANWRAIYEPAATRRRLGLDPDKPVLLFTTTQITEIDEVVALVFMVVRRNPGLQLIVKMHPAERESGDYRRAADRAGLKPVIIQDCDLYELLSASIALVSPISTTLVDAAVMGRPSILLDPLKLDRVAVLDHHPAITVTTSAEDLATAVAAVLGSRESAVDQHVTADFVERFGLRLDGLAHQRVADLVRAAEELDAED
jgi:CDP-glycerol glycerophosphotransferase (TagB/SpsB family)